jgi:hypothetical protein
MSSFSAKRLWVALSETVEPVGTARLLAGPELELKVVDEDEGEL